MPRPRKYKDNAARQAAYRRRLKRGEVQHMTSRHAFPATQALTERILAADAKARAET